MNAIEHSETQKWEHPESYAGFNPVGDYVVYTRNRDSTILENCNYELIFDELKKLCTDDWPENPDIESGKENYVYDFRAGHWAIGWVEYLLVRQDAPDNIKQLAGEIVCALSYYPIYDDEYYSYRRDEEITEYWDKIGLREKIDWCKESDISIFSARSDDIPEKVYDAMCESDMFY